MALSFHAAAARVTELYRAPSAHWYVRVKLRTDPVLGRLWQLASSEAFGTIADVGCGRGQAGLLLVVGGVATSVVGLDWDAAKIAAATAAARDLAAAFERADVRTASIPTADTVLLLDVLHYLDDDAQDDLLRRASRASRLRLIVRDLEDGRGAKSWLTRGLEWAATTAGYNRGQPPRTPRSFAEMTSFLEDEGFAVTRETCSLRGLSNVLLVARR